MAKNMLFTDKEIDFIKALNRHRVPYMIVGVAAAALQGAPAITQDIDLWFKDIYDANLRAALREVDGALVPSFGLNPPALAGRSLRLFDIVLTMHGLGRFDEEMKNTVTVRLGRTQVKVLKLERIIKSKEALKRNKDLLVLPVLRDTLAVLKAKKLGGR